MIFPDNFSRFSNGRETLIHIHKRLLSKAMGCTCITLRGELLAYQSGIPNRLSWAVRRWYVSEHLVLITLPPAKLEKKSVSIDNVINNVSKCQKCQLYYWDVYLK